MGCYTFGIELNTLEILALSHYLRSFCNENPGRRGEARVQAQFLFLKNYFGLDLDELGDRVVYGADEKGEYPTEKRYGMKLLGTPEFKKYCKRKVREWREELELI